jgi:hypothetical protein
MTKNMALATTDGNSGAVAPQANWQTALDTFLNTLSSPRTQKAYKRAVTEAMRAMGVHGLADLTPSMLAAYRAGLVARLDVDREDRLSSSAINLKLGAVRSFLHFCRLAGVPPLGCAHCCLPVCQTWHPVVESRPPEDCREQRVRQRPYPG